MGSVKWSITLSPELAEALERLAAARGDSRSALVETLLRESGYVQRFVDEVRADDRLAPPRRKSPHGAGVEAGVRLKRGRDPAKLRAIAESGRRAWRKAEAEGRVRMLD